MFLSQQPNHGAMDTPTPEEGFTALTDDAERNRLLAADVRDLKEGTEAVEEIARKDLGMIRDGESFFLIVEPQQDPDRD